MAVMKASHLEELCLKHLGDTTTYEKLKKDPSDALQLKVNKTLKDILTRHDFSTTFINNLQSPTTARTQHFYGLPCDILKLVGRHERETIPSRLT